MIIKTLEEAIEVVKDVRSEMEDARDGIAVQAIDMVLETVKEPRPRGKWGKWVISEVRCPECLEYFDTDCYSKEEMDKCPNCGADMRKEGEAE